MSDLSRLASTFLHGFPAGLALWLVALSGAPATPAAAAGTLKLAFFNIQSGKGEPALRGRPSPFVDTSNCTGF